MSSFNGIGSNYIGETDWLDDGSYITTEYFILIFIPIFPIQSVRVYKEEGNSVNSPFGYSEVRNLQIKRIPLHTKSVLPFVAKIWGGIILFISMGIIATTTENQLLALGCVFGMLIVVAIAFGSLGLS